MADVGLDSILLTLLGVQKDAEADSPFVPITDATDLIGKTLIQSSPNYSIGENILAGLLTGAVGGLAQRGTKNYADEQSKLAQPVLDQILQGRSVFEKPEGLSDSIFTKVSNAGSIFAKEKELQRKDLEDKYAIETAAAIERAKQLAPIEIATEQAKLNALYGGLTPAMQDDVLKQRAQAEDKFKIIEAADSLFDQAQGVSSLSTLNPTSPNWSKMSGIGVALTNLVQKIQGREINEAFRKQLAKALPGDFDNAEQIESKRNLYKEMVSAISPSTPLAMQASEVASPYDNSIQLQAGQQSPEAPQPQVKIVGGVQYQKVQGGWMPIK